jgi:3-deoxy-D-manno-octulosonate 8-phosphate phosphatase KdsC-like HAD superfamily phosphatase
MAELSSSTSFFDWSIKEQNIKIGIITGEKSKIVKNRGKKLKMDYIFMNAKNKVLIISIYRL